MIEQLVLIPILPFIAFLTIMAWARRWPNLSSYLSISAIGASFLLALSVVFPMIKMGGYEREYIIPWFSTGNLHIDAGILFDSLTAVMLIVVTSVSLLVQIFSMGYMRGDDGFARFYALLSLFTFSMLGLVLANNFIVIFVFWELVGLCSYALIGYWFKKPVAAAAGKKAFIVTKIGDAGFLIGILFLSATAGTFNFTELQNMIYGGQISAAIITILCICIFCGAAGKSAQFPLHVWLPDAMEGPSPVSALIHAATMVAAGVYLVGRTYMLFDLSSTSLLMVGYIGGFTALLAATMALFQDDIKRILAYSTISQLGYMMMALGVGGYSASFFHLMTHAFFKALLFLAAGSVIHAVHTNDIWRMGGVFKPMRITATTFIIGALSLSGIPPLSGFWSKDEILVKAYTSGQPIIFVMGIFTAFLTAFYMFRLCFVVFFGRRRLKNSNDNSHDDEHSPHESPPVMTIPLSILAILAIVAGLVGSPWMNNWFQGFLHFGEINHQVGEETGSHNTHTLVMIASIIVAVSGIVMAWVIYSAKLVPVERLKTTFIYKLLKGKYYFDEIYDYIIVQPFIKFTKRTQIFDLTVIDGTVNGIAWIVREGGSRVRRLQTGVVQNYILLLTIGLISLIIFSWYFR